MSEDAEFHAHVRDLFRPLGPVAIRRMFGGAGVFLDGVMFALIAWDQLFMKADDLNRDAFEAAGSARFRYRIRGGGTNEMSYYELPADAFDDPDEALRWGRSAHAAALRAHKPKGTTVKAAAKKRKAR